VIVFENFSFALFTPPLGDFQRGMEGSASTGELAMMAGMALTSIETARTGGGVRGRLGYSSGVVAKVGRALMARRRGERGSAADAPVRHGRERRS
jgi:hypothetical protein